MDIIKSECISNINNQVEYVMKLKRPTKYKFDYEITLNFKNKKDKPKLGCDVISHSEIKALYPDTGDSNYCNLYYLADNTGF